MNNFLDKKMSYIEARRGIKCAGSFAIESRSGITPIIDVWWKCRDIFHDNSHKIHRFLFQCETGTVKNIVSFFNKLETKLKVKPKTTFVSTDKDDVLWVYISRWWSYYSMKRSLFTILLRASQHYNPKRDNFYETLWNEEYFLDTEHALKRFLNGHTSYRGNIRGWHNQFHWGGLSGSKPTIKKIKELLVKP